MKKCILSVLLLSLLLYSCSKEKLEEEENLKYVKLGNEITQKTAKVLQKTLKYAMKKNGVKSALNVCNLSAMELTKSLENEYKVEINRKSHRNRNTLNKASMIEDSVINDYIRIINAKKELKPKIIRNNNDVTYYFPILTGNACLQCHGKPMKDIDKENFRYIKSIYPNDLATGFKNGDLRGIWSVKFNNKNN